jgi:hypothetical protein
MGRCKSVGEEEEEEEVEEVGRKWGMTGRKSKADLEVEVEVGFGCAGTGRFGPLNSMK